MSGEASGIPAGGASAWKFERKPASGKAASGTPAKGWSAPVQQPVHGAYSPRVVGLIAAELRDGVLERRPDLQAYPEAVTAWARSEAAAMCLREYLDRVGVVDDTDEPRAGLLDLLRRHEDSAAKHRSVLGLDPRSEAGLARERASASVLAVDLESIAERGRAIREARDGAVGDALTAVRDAYAARWPDERG